MQEKYVVNPGIEELALMPLGNPKHGRRKRGATARMGGLMGNVTKGFTTVFSKDAIQDGLWLGAGMIATFVVGTLLNRVSGLKIDPTVDDVTKTNVRLKSIGVSLLAAGLVTGLSYMVARKRSAQVFTGSLAIPVLKVIRTAGVGTSWLSDPLLGKQPDKGVLTNILPIKGLGNGLGNIALPAGTQGGVVASDIKQLTVL